MIFNFRLMILVAISVAAYSRDATAQTIGFTGGPHVANSNNVKATAVSWSVGVYFDQPISKKLSFQTGIDLVQYDQQKVWKPIENMSLYHNLLEVPVYLSYDLLNNTDQDRNLNLSFGCSFGKITRVTAHALQTGDVPGPYISFATGPALEYKFHAGPANVGAFGFRTRYITNLYHSRNFIDVGAYARFGFNLIKETKEEVEEIKKPSR